MMSSRKYCLIFEHIDFNVIETFLKCTDIKFTLDWKFEGPAAPFFIALDKGYFAEEDLNVTIDTGAGLANPSRVLRPAPTTWVSATSMP
jgi:hypothetical protein